MQTLTLATQKGGSGKSTLAIGLAVAAMEAGERVVVLEIDRQGTVSKWAERRSMTEPMVERVAEAYDLERSLRRLAARGCTLAIIDTPSGSDGSVATAIEMADLCLIPARPSPADIEASHATIHTARRLRKDFAFVLNQTPARASRPSQVASALNEYGVLALPFIVQRNDHQDLLGAGLAASEFAPDGKAAEEVHALWSWVKRKLDHAPHEEEHPAADGDEVRDSARRPSYHQEARQL